MGMWSVRLPTHERRYEDGDERARRGHAIPWCASIFVESFTLTRSGAVRRVIIRSMSKPRRNLPLFSLDNGLVPGKPRKVVPHEFVLDALAPLSPQTRPMFGCLAIYVGDKIVLILRDKPGNTADNGVWLATTEDHHASLRHDFPNMRSIEVFGKDVTGWQVLPVDAPDFEETAMRACEMVAARDPRIGKVPGKRRANKSATEKAPKNSAHPRPRKTATKRRASK
jgi:hypothetical protein